MLSWLVKSGKKKNTASIAKERLQIIVAHERAKNSNSNNVDFLPDLQRDILAVVRKYMPISDKQIKVSMERDENTDVLELNIILNQEDIE